MATRETIPNALWEPAEKPIRTSPDRRWFVTSEANSVVLVDLEFKNAPADKGTRLAKARFDPIWHQERATAATKTHNWCEAVFHYAWLVKHDSNQKSFNDGLQASFEKLTEQFGASKG